MHTEELAFELPTELIAQHPPAQRRDARMMLVPEGATGEFTITTVGEGFLDQLRPTDLVVVNDSRVLHARLRIQRPGGGEGELLLLEPVGDGTWSAMARPARRLKPGMVVTTASGAQITCVERNESGTWRVALPIADNDADDWLRQHGEVPLPPYIAPAEQDAARYQTVYAHDAGSVAAPTAGLHFDNALWTAVREKCSVARVTLHVGVGTFQPVATDNLSDHVMHSERYFVSSDNAEQIQAALDRDARIIAVGTTSVRVLEHVFDRSTKAPTAPLTGRTDVFITPGYSFRTVDCLLTNFHLPKSTLIALVMARAGTDTIRAAYAQAIRDKLRFFSFGDCMFISPAN